jgi:hypothetical protein
LSSGLYYKDIVNMNDDYRVVRMTLPLQVVASPIIVFLTTLEVSFRFLENIIVQSSLTIVKIFS